MARYHWKPFPFHCTQWWQWSLLYIHAYIHWQWCLWKSMTFHDGPKYYEYSEKKDVTIKKHSLTPHERWFCIVFFFTREHHNASRDLQVGNAPPLPPPETAVSTMIYLFRGRHWIESWCWCTIPCYQHNMMFLSLLLSIDIVSAAGALISSCNSLRGMI